MNDGARTIDNGQLLLFEPEDIEPVWAVFFEDEADGGTVEFHRDHLVDLFRFLDFGATNALHAGALALAADGNMIAAWAIASYACMFAGWDVYDSDARFEVYAPPEMKEV